MRKNLLEQKIARLEFENDQLLAELQDIDQLLRSIGFIDGLKTIKGVVNEILEGEAID